MAENETPKIKRDGTIKYNDKTKVSNSFKIGDYETKGLVKVENEHGKIVHSSLEESKRVHEGVKKFHKKNDSVVSKTATGLKNKSKKTLKNGASRYVNSAAQGLKNSTKGTFEQETNSQPNQGGLLKTAGGEASYRLKRKGIDYVKRRHREKKLEKNTTVIHDNGDGTYTINHSKAERKKGAPSKETIKGDYTKIERRNQLAEKQKEKIDKKANRVKEKQKKKNAKKVAKEAKKSATRKSVEKGAKAVGNTAKAAAAGTKKVVAAVLGPLLIGILIVAIPIAMIIFIPLVAGMGGAAGTYTTIAASSYQNDEDELKNINTQYSTNESIYVNTLISHATDPYAMRDTLLLYSDGTVKEPFGDGEYYEIEYDVPMERHNPYTLLSYLTAVSDTGKITTDTNTLATIFNQLLSSQYQDNSYLTVSKEKRTVKALMEDCAPQVTVEDDPTTPGIDETQYGACEWNGKYHETTVETEVPILRITITNNGLDTVVNGLMDTSQKDMYAVLQDTLGNFPDLYGSDYSQYLTAGSGGISVDYKPSQEELANTDFETIYNTAIQALGKPYVSGRDGPDEFDCSGFVHWVLNNSGYNLPDWTAQGQYEYFGSVPESERQPGDLVYLHTHEGGDYVTHIGIYLGDDMMISCDSGQTMAVRISPLSWWRADGYAPVGYGHVY